MDIQNKKIELIQWFATLEDVSLLKKILKLKKEDTKDWWKEVEETEKKSILKGISDAEKGKLKPQSEAKKIYGKWL